MNFISGTYDAVEGLFLSPELGFRLPIGRAESWAGGPASLGIRSEDISIENSVAPADDSAFSATVYEVEPLGAYTIVDLAIGQSIFRAQIPGQPRFEPDQRVRFSFDLAKCHLFNGASEARVAVNDPMVRVSSAQTARRE
jgi:ABC-type sugar transport system ATPase subunit